MLARIPEPEVMDGCDDALAYDAMDHSEVNQRFVADALAGGEPSGPVLDLGAGNGLISILLAMRLPGRIAIAADASAAMLELARNHVVREGLRDRVRLDLVRAQSLWYHDGSFPLVVSNSLVHHLAEPLPAIKEAWRVTQPGGRVFFRDLCRPESESDLSALVDQYSLGAPPRARQLFADSLRASFNPGEVRALVGTLGCPPESVAMSSDRHWTWSATKTR